MGPESSGKELGRCYMMVDGQPVEVMTGFAEITFAGSQQGDKNLALDDWEVSVKMKIMKPMRCRSRRRFVKLLMASGIDRNVAQVLARGYVVWSNQRGTPAILKMSYQEYFIDLWIRGIVRPGKAGRAV